MLYMAIISLFVLATTTAYVLIKYAKNHMAVFVLVPMLIASSLLSYTAFKQLEGSPIKGYPEGNFTVLSSIAMKPDILIMVRHEEGHLKSYLIPFSQANASAMNREEEFTKKGVARKGWFRKNQFDEIRYVIHYERSEPLPPKTVPPNQQTTSASEARGK